MRQILSFILLAYAITSVCAQPRADRSSHHEIRAVWLATIGGIDWPRNYARDGASAARQRRELTDMLDRLQKVGINTVLLQTRIRGTVIYPSRLEPWDGCMSGRPGVSPGYDPLRFAIDECHKRGMELHAWVVAIPLGKWDGAGCRNMKRTHPGVVRRIGPDGFLNPEVSQSGDIIAEVCEEIARNYDVDGIHLDYIRYPDGWKIGVSRAAGRSYITDIVRKVNRAVKGVRRQIKLSCSPVGKYSDLTRYSSRGWNAYNAVCQDAQGWLRSGLMDQLYPMMYFRGNQFFPFAIDWAEHRYGGEVAAGLGIYFLDRREGNWKIDEVKRQLAVCRQYGLGQCFFRAKFLLDNVQGLYDYLRIWNHQDLLPVSLGGRLLDAPSHDFDGASPHSADMTPHLGRIDTARPPVIANDGLTMTLPHKPVTLDADHLLVESLTGSIIATLPYHTDRVSIGHIPDGTYMVRSLGRKGVTHRLGFLTIKRQSPSNP